VDRRDRRFAFDGFVFDPATGEVSGRAGATRLPPKPARLLARLLERPGELVSREELQQDLWPDQHLEIDQALAYTVRQVRTALGDEAGEPRFVETLPKRGYRFIGRLEEVLEARDDGGAPDRDRAGERAGAAPSRSRRARIAVALTLAAASVAAWLWLGAAREGRGPGAVRVALLPLHDPGAAAANARLTEALLVALTAQPGLDVVGPATTAAHRGTRRPHPELGRELGVAFVVSGGYRPGERVLFLQLIRVSDGGHLFAHRYQGTEDELRRQLPAAAGALAAAATENGQPLPAGEAAPRADRHP
jgi:DNA-binding winged helix-turn-helix (wHTH) protein/TolB-like protein